MVIAQPLSASTNEMSKADEATLDALAVQAIGEEAGICILVFLGEGKTLLRRPEFSDFLMDIDRSFAPSFSRERKCLVTPESPADGEVELAVRFDAAATDG